jgi:hypothetical protein
VVDRLDHGLVDSVDKVGRAVDAVGVEDLRPLDDGLLGLLVVLLLLGLRAAASTFEATGTMVRCGKSRRIQEKLTAR